MALVIKLVLESLRFAANALRTNLLRTILSLLGVTVGIFAIIAVFTLVDSLEKNIKDSLSFLNSQNLDIRRFPYDFGPNIPWWEYIKRPYTNYEEYKFLEKNLKNAEGITLFAVKWDVTLKRENNSSTGRYINGIAYSHKDVYDIEIGSGRYFTETEAMAGRNVAIIGHEPIQDLFPRESPIGKEIKIRGLKFTIIGTIPQQGENVFGDSGDDEVVYIPYQTFKKLYHSSGNRGVETLITVRGKEDDIGLVELHAEITGLLRTIRSLKPKEKDNFSVNRQDAIMNIIGSTFDIIGIAGWVIGSFSILVGGFGIANIMFVSVRERTNIIGIQKSLGAKNYFILFQFLFESVFLSVIGGGVGILLVFLLTFVDLGSLDLALTIKNITIGLGVSAAIGTASGIIPAAMAARLDPVIAIRS